MIIKDSTNLSLGAAVIRGDNTKVPGLRVYGGPTDPISDIPVIIDFEHHQIHEGETHRSQDLQLSLGTTTVKYGFTTGNHAKGIDAPHLLLGANCYADTANGGVLIQLYEGATFTGGTPMSIYNRNRNSLTVPKATVSTGVTSTNGTLILSHFFTVGGETRISLELICKPNTIYRIDAIGQKTGTQAIIDFTWYEDLGV